MNLDHVKGGLILGLNSEFPRVNTTNLDPNLRLESCLHWSSYPDLIHFRPCEQSVWITSGVTLWVDLGECWVECGLQPLWKRSLVFSAYKGLRTSSNRNATNSGQVKVGG